MTESAMTINTATGPYRLQVASERSLRLVEVMSPAERRYLVAVDGHGRGIMCLCPGFAARWHCKHLGMVQDALRDPGIPLRLAGTRLTYNFHTDTWATVQDRNETESDVFARLP